MMDPAIQCYSAPEYPRLRALAGAHMRQQDFLLDTDKSVFTPSFVLYWDGRAEALVAGCVFTLGVPAFVPEAHEVSAMETDFGGVLHVPGTPIHAIPTRCVAARVPWDDFVGIVGGLLLPTPHWPTRYLLAERPCDGQVAMLRSAGRPVSSMRDLRPVMGQLVRALPDGGAEYRQRM